MNPCITKDGRHNFAVAGMNCMNGCGANQNEISGRARRVAVETISTSLEKIKQRKPRRGIHSELHELIAKMREDFGETATKGIGSFSYYLGMLRRVPPSVICMWYGDIKDSPKLDTPLARCKIFWWKYRVWKKGK